MIHYAPKELIADRLPIVFPEGTPNRNNCINDVAASVVFVMIYIDAVEGSERYLGPKHVYCMSDEQADRTSDGERLDYGTSCYKRSFKPFGTRWYADNTRESIRDDVIREGLSQVGAIGELSVPTTSSKPRYFLHLGVANLFNPALESDALRSAIEAWQHSNLSAPALARVELLRRGAGSSKEDVLATFPNGETRRLATGPSSTITKAVIEEFAPRFLLDPAVLWVSESGNKVVSRDDDLARAIGIEIEADRNLPDIVLVDVGSSVPIIVFVEVVASDGPVSERRREALLELAIEAGFEKTSVAFVTAYRDRGRAEFRKSAPVLAWGSFAWFLSEPDKIIWLSKPAPAKTSLLSDLISRGPN